MQLYFKSLFMKNFSFKQLLFLSSFLLGMQSMAQNKNGVGLLSGKITSKFAQNLLRGTIVSIVDVSASAVVDAEGFYRLDNIPNGKHLISVHQDGFNGIAISIIVQGTTTKNFELIEMVAETEQVVVTGNGQAQKAKNAPTPITVLNNRQIFNSSGTNLMETLAQTVRGFNVSTTGPAIAKPVIRGLSYNRILTINDGARQEGQQWGDEHGIEIGENSVNKIEVLKGAASLAYGSDAIGGVINVQTYSPVANGVVKGDIMYNGMQNNSSNGFYADLQGNENGFHYGFKGGAKGAADYSNKYDGSVLNSRFNERNYGGYLGVREAWGGFTLYGGNFNQQTGIVTGDRDNDGNFLLYKGKPFEKLPTTGEINSKTALTPYQTINHKRFGIDNFVNVGKNILNVNLGYQNNLRKEFGDPTAATTPGLVFNLTTLTYKVAMKLADKNNWKSNFGINGMSQKHKNGGEENIIPLHNLFDVGAYFITHKTFNKTTFTGGARFDNRSINSMALASQFTAFNKNFSNISGSSGVAVEANNYLTLKLNVARGFRAPNIAELASNGAHEGTNRYEYGNTNLKSETSLQFDAAVEVASEHFSMSVTPFYNRINNYIFYDGLNNRANTGDSLVNVDGEDIRAFEFKQNNAALIRGVEFNVDIHPHPLDWLHFENTISLIRGTFANAPSGSTFNTAFNLPFMPTARWVSEVRAQFLKNGANMRNAFFKVQMDKNGAQDNIFGLHNTETFTPAYTLWNVGLGTELHFEGYHFATINAGVQNATNEGYQSHLSRLKYADENGATGRNGVFNMGQNFYVKVNFPINIKPRYKKEVALEIPKEIINVKPLDTDNDGVNDEDDKCPTVVGVAAYKGCPVPDTDGDSINDDTDKCPTEFGNKENNGCPVVVDTDNDGIVDLEDKCPTVFGIAANFGCPAVVEKVEDKNVEVVEKAAKNILFETASDKLKVSSNAALNNIATLLKEDETVQLVIEGHTDNVGTNERNQLLSEKRANAAKNYLVKKGVTAERIIVIGYGSTQPIADNTTAEGRALNRRVVLKIGS